MGHDFSHIGRTLIDASCQIPQESRLSREVLPHREGLNVRAGQSDSAQVSIEMGQGYDLDNEIEGLRSDVGRLKQVSASSSVSS